MAAQAATTAVLDRSSKLTLGFGLVSIPIRYKALAADRKPISGKLICPEHKETVSQFYKCGAETDHEHLLTRGECVSAFPHPDDKSQLVVVDPDVQKEFELSRTGAAAIEGVVDVHSIDPIYFDQTYLVDADNEPGDAGLKFDIFAYTLRDEGKAAITTTVISKQTRMVIFRWSEELECLVAHVCRFQSWIKHGEIQGVRDRASHRDAPPKEHLEMGKQFFATLPDLFDPAEVDDEWTPMMQDAIRQAAGGKVVSSPKAKKAEPAKPAEDLLAALKGSVAAAQKKPAAKPAAKKPAAKRTTRSKTTA
jgi:DNA end-binding protein Ku